MKKYYIVLLLIQAITCFAATPPDAKDVFQLNVQVHSNALILKWNIKSGFFLYKDRITVTAVDENNITIAKFILPGSQQKTDSNGRTFNIYRQQLTLNIDILGHLPGEQIITVNFQGCSDEGFCYPPQSESIKLTFDTNSLLQSANIEQDSKSITVHEEENNFHPTLYNHHWSVILLAFFGFGLLLSFTPCVLPMIPILSGIIIGQKKISTQKAFFLSLSYVFGMSLTYAAAGAVVATLGKNLQVILQSNIVISLFAVLFILLALSMFDLYEIRMPHSWQNKIAKNTRLGASGHFFSAFIMGALSILIVSPCVSAPLIGALTYIAQSGNVLLGSLILFCLGLGMGIPLLLIGTGAGKLLPKTGVWMNQVKGLFGIILFAVAIQLLGRIIPDFLNMILWGALFIFAGIYAGALINKSSIAGKCSQVFGILLLTYGLLILIGASIGNKNPWLPLQTHNIQHEDNKIIVVNNLTMAKQAIQNNIDSKPFFIEFYAQWCESCKHIEKTVLKDKRVQALLNDFIVIKVDVTKVENAQKLFEYFNVVAPPTFIIYNSDALELKDLRRVGEISTKELITILMKALNE